MEIRYMIKRHSIRLNKVQKIWFLYVDNSLQDSGFDIRQLLRKSRKLIGLIID